METVARADHDTVLETVKALERERENVLLEMEVIMWWP
jgi:hypothetical protein